MSNFWGLSFHSSRIFPTSFLEFPFEVLFECNRTALCWHYWNNLETGKSSILLHVLSSKECLSFLVPWEGQERLQFLRMQVGFSLWSDFSHCSPNIFSREDKGKAVSSHLNYANWFVIRENEELSHNSSGS